MSDTSTIDLPKNRFADYQVSLDHAKQNFSLARLTDENALRALGAVSHSTMHQSTEMIQRAILRPITIEAQKLLSEMHIAAFSVFIESSQAIASAMSSRPLRVSHFRDISYRTASSEWHSLFEKLEGFRDYVDGWNGYSAPAPNNVAVDSARGFLDVMRECMFVPTRVSASAVGGVGITRREGPKKVFVEFFNNGMVSALFADDSAQCMFTKQVTPDWESYEHLISDMKDYLSGRNARRDENKGAAGSPYF